jgi:hypothetical protein
MTRNMHVPAYDPAEVGLQLAEYRGVVWEFVKTISIVMDDEPIFSMMAGQSLSKRFSFAAKKGYKALVADSECTRDKGRRRGGAERLLPSRRIDGNRPLI